MTASEKYSSSKVKLFLVFVGISLGVVFLTNLLLYSFAVDIEKQKLQALSQIHAEMIGAVARFDRLHNKKFSEGGSRGATLRQITNAHFEKIVFGETGEFIIGEKNNNQIDLLIPSRILGSEISPVELDGAAAEPLQRALRGRSGFMSGLDYRGEAVFAWHEPLTTLDAGFVAKIDVSEIRQPYIIAIILGSLIALVISGLASMLFHKVEARCISREKIEKPENNSLRQQTILYLTLIGCLVSVALVSVVSAAGFVYSSEVDRRKTELAGLTSGMSAFIDAVAVFDSEHTQKNTSQFNKATDATISQIKESVKHRPGFGETGEIVIGVVSGNQMKFLLPSRFTGTQPSPVNLKGKVAEPLRKAISGQSGVSDSIDYRGKSVLAAFRPIQHLGGGLVVKMDVDEILRPYVIVGSINISLAVFLIVFGILLAPQFLESMRVYIGRESLIQSKNSLNFTLESLLHHGALALIIGLAGFLFYVDTISPLGMAAGIPYIGLIIVGSFLTEKKGLLLLAGFVTALVFGGLALAPDQDALTWQVVTNRIYPILTIWLAVIILLRTKNADQSIRQILTSAGEGIYGLDDQGVTIFVNPAACNMLGYSEQELLGQPMHPLVHHSHPDGSEYLSVECPMYAAFTDGDIHHVEDEVLWRKDGTAIPISYVSTPIRKADQLTGAVVTFSDATESKRHERELRRRAKALERSNEELEKFAYAASHDLQEPLRKIQSFSELLALDYESSLDEVGLGYLERLTNSATRMRTLIDDLLSFSRVTSTVKPFTEVALGALVDEVLDDMETVIDQADAEIIVAALPAIQCDKTQIRLVVQNLLSNSIKFKKNNVPLIIEIKSQTKNDDISIIVSDNGIGFEQKFAERIFGLFERLHGRNEYSGTGIGLASCKKIAERHGGNIVAEGRPGEGSTFTVTLPVNLTEGIL